MSGELTRPELVDMSMWLLIDASSWVNEYMLMMHRGT